MITRKASEANFIAACWAMKANRQTGRRVSVRSVLNEYQVGSNAYPILKRINTDTILNDSVIEELRQEYQKSNKGNHRESLRRMMNDNPKLF